MLTGAAMFNTPTVFILGAGASWHYGYPTGETLVEKVIERASSAARFFEYGHKAVHSDRPDYINDGDTATSWRKAHDECLRLKAGLEQVRPLVIDYYLGWNPDLQNIGRLLIAWVILECECFSQNRNINRDGEGNNDWCRFVIHQLAMNCKSSDDLQLNRVSFVTFNYDISLETRLRDGLGHIQMFSKADVEKFLVGSRIVHIYGKIREEVASAAKVDWNVRNQDPEHLRGRTANYHTSMKALLDAAHAASKGLRVIDPHDKGTDDREIMIARSAIADAERTFILGYGFDENNNNRLNLRAYLRHATDLLKKPVAFTNYRDINQINKRASNLFYGSAQYFPPGGPAIQDRYEKSTRNTYDALAMDFDLAT
jgi:hypothetical protein